MSEQQAEPTSGERRIRQRRTGRLSSERPASRGQEKLRKTGRASNLPIWFPRRADAAKVEAAKVEAPKVEAPKVEPKVEAAEVEAAKPDAPKSDVPGRTRRAPRARS